MPRGISRLSHPVSLLIAMLVLITWVVFATLSTAMLIRVWPSPFGTGLSLAFLFLAFGSRPRFPTRPVGEPIKRTDAPELFRLVDEIAAHLQSPPINTILFDGQTNAWTARFGFRRTLTIGIGFPLWEALSPAERVATLAHEVSHNVNGDLRRGFIVGNSLLTLATWVTILRPAPTDDVGAYGAYLSLARILQWILVSPVIGVSYLLRRVTLASSRHAEFESDRLGATIAGTDAILGALDKLIFASAMDRAVVASVRTGDDLWDGIRVRLNEIPELDRSAIREEARKVLSRADDTHPPTHLRINALRDLPRSPPRIQLDPNWNDLIDRELDPVRVMVERRIRNPVD